MRSRDMAANDACTVKLATIDDSNLLQVVLDDSAGFRNADVFGLRAAQLIDAHQVHIALVGDPPIGCVMVTVADSVVIHGLNVVQGHRNRGHATTLVRAALAHNDGAHATEVYWTAVDPNVEGARERFVKLGFENVAGEHCGRFSLMIRRSSAGSGRERAAEGSQATPTAGVQRRSHG